MHQFTFIRKCNERTNSIFWSKYDLEILKILVPTIATMSLDPIMSFVDASIVAKLGTVPLAGVGMSATQIILLTNFFTFFMILTVPQVADCWVKDDNDGISRIVSDKIWLAIICGILTGCFVLFTAEPYVKVIIGAEARVSQHAITYLCIRALVIPIVMIQFVLVGVFRGCQDALQPLIAQITAVALNIILDVIFVLVLQWGVGGSAWATVVGYCVSCSYLAVVLYRRNMIQFAHFRKFPEIKQVFDDLSNGVAISMRNFATFVYFTISNSVLAQLGAASQAAFEITRQAFTVSGQALWAFNPASLAVISKYIAQKQQLQAKTVFFRCIQISIFLSAIIGAILISFQNQFVAQFSTDPEVINQVGAAILVAGITFCLDACSACVEGAMAANKQAKQLGFNSVVSTVLAAVVLLCLTGLGFTGVTVVMLAMRIIPIGRFCGNWPQLFFNQNDFLEVIDDDLQKTPNLQT